MAGSKKKSKDSKVVLACSVCAHRNYTTPKSQGQNAQGPATIERLELSKFCPHCQTHTLHKETK